MEPITWLILAAGAIGAGAAWYSWKRRQGGKKK
jgi:LPXTG-motif cell wall-anchored protein